MHERTLCIGVAFTLMFSSATHVHEALAVSRDDRDQLSESRSKFGWISGGGGCLAAGVFYAAVYLIAWPPLNRYFLGHPVAVAATILFWIAASILLGKWMIVAGQWDRLQTTRDEDLAPPVGEASPAGRWKRDHDAGYVAREWKNTIAELPRPIRAGALVRRLDELLTRQSQRGTTKHLADDLRELSGRDADIAHDSLGLVRIIVWAIPMLGFLGTVIGITQTLGGLDFTDGSAAVDRLKSGLYVAFDTTALGLVLSVVAIFLQHPVEQSEQRLLGEIDARVGNLLSNHLPSDDASEDQTALVAELCEGIRAAVAESLAGQTKLWRETIDEAQSRWHAAQQAHGSDIAHTIERTFGPALLAHADALEKSGRVAGDRLQQQLSQFQETLIGDAATLSAHHQVLARQCDRLTSHYEQIEQSRGQTEAMMAAQSALDSNLKRLQETNVAIERSITAAAGDGMSEAMRILARAVDVLSVELSQTRNASISSARRAA